MENETMTPQETTGAIRLCWHACRQLGVWRTDAPDMVQSALVHVLRYWQPERCPLGRACWQAVRHAIRDARRLCRAAPETLGDDVAYVQDDRLEPIELDCLCEENPQFARRTVRAALWGWRND